MKKYMILFVAMLIISTFFCGCSDSKEAAYEKRQSYNIQMQDESEMKPDVTFEDIMYTSDNIVKAKLLSGKSFSDTYRYRFSVITDYTGNTPNEIYVYTPYDEEYIEGHTYYLCLNKAEQPLYPHSIFTVTYVGLILDEDNKNVRVTENSSIEITKAEKVISDFVLEHNSYYKASSDEIVSYANNLSELDEEADAIAEIKLLSEKKANEYVSLYEIETVNMVKGNINYMAQCISLPPNLELNKSYYVFLKLDPDSDTDYVIFSKKKPVVLATERVRNVLDMNAKE